jgi:hypothetical protein
LLEIFPELVGFLWSIDMTPDIRHQNPGITITINAIKRDITVSGAGRFCLFFLFTTAGHKIIPRIINKQEWPALNIVSFR